tara:strand:- start:15913 stop:16170 length:258 start_codon:yes stop_codon:yes gene_type:complete
MFWQKKAKLVKYPDPMSGEDITRIFKEVGEGAKLWQALDAVLDNILLDAVNDVSDPKNNVTQFAHAAGRVDAISGLKARLEEYKK